VDVAIALLFVAYFVPTLRAEYREHRRLGCIFLVNLLAGWTGVGWVAVLAWAGHDRTEPQAEPVVVRRRGHLRLVETR